MRNSRYIRASFLGGVFAFPFVCASPVAAQSDSDPVEVAPDNGEVAADQDADSGARIDDIVVTAQKRSERLQDVPIAVTALTGETLARAGVESTSALNAMVPGLTLVNSPARFAPFIRGVGTSTPGGGNENSVSLYVDNIYLTSMTAGLLNLANVEAIEVLKGPQGTLFGRNSAGGVIHVRTRDPSHQLGGKVSLDYGAYDTITGTGYITGGLSDTLAADLSVYYRDQGDGYGTNFVNGNEIYKGWDFSIRSKIQFTPTDVDQLTLAVDYSKSRNTGLTWRNAPGTTSNWGGPPDAENPLPFGSPYVARGGPWDIDSFFDPEYRGWFGGVSLSYERELPWATLTSYTAYRKSKIFQRFSGNVAPLALQEARWNQLEDQFSQELQLSSLPQSDVKWILGAYYLQASFAYDPFTIFNYYEPVFPNFLAKQTTRSPALYGQVTVPVPALGDTNITGGLRYTIDRRAVEGEFQLLAAANPSIAVATLLPTDAKRTFKTFTWRLGIDHHFTPDIMAYASYNRGFKGGVYNLSPVGGPNATPTEPELLDAYEIGVKNTLFDGIATLNVAAFFYQYQNLQVTVFDQGTTLVTNAAAAEIMGVDLEADLQATDNLRLSLRAEYLDHKFTRYEAAPIYSLVPVTQGGGVDRTFGDLSGRDLPFASDFSVSGSLFFEQPTSAGDLDVAVNVAWNDGFNFEPSDVVRQNSFFDISATAGWTSPDGRTRISIYGRNLANAKIARANVVSGNPGGYFQLLYQPPRTYGISVSQEF